MRGLVKHEKRNMLIITLAFTIVVWFVLQGAIASDIAGTGNQIMTTMEIYFWERSISIMNHLL